MSRFLKGVRLMFMKLSGVWGSFKKLQYFLRRATGQAKRGKEGLTLYRLGGL